jgi:hypothetical protein
MMGKRRAIQSARRVSDEYVESLLRSAEGD